MHVRLLVCCVLVPCLLSTGCRKQAGSAEDRKRAKEVARTFERVEPDIRKEVEKFFLPRLTRSPTYPFGDPEMLAVLINLDEARSAKAGEVPFRARVFLGGRVPPLATNVEEYRRRLRYDRLPGLARLDPAGKLSEVELGDEQAEMHLRIDVATGKISGQEKLGPGGR